MFPIWRSTAPLFRSSLPGLRNSLARPSLLPSPQSPLLRGISSSSLSSSPLLCTTPLTQQQQPQNIRQPLLSSRFCSSDDQQKAVEEGKKTFDEVSAEAGEVLQKGKDLYERGDYKGCYDVLLKAYDNYEKENKLQHLFVLSPLIFSACEKGGLVAEQKAFEERSDKAAPQAQISKEQEEKAKELEKKAKNLVEQTTDVYRLQGQGKSLMERGEFGEAKKIFWDALRKADDINPPNDGLLALLNAQCGAIQGHIGEYEEAEAHLRASIRHYKKVVGNNLYLKEYLETLRLLGDLFMKRRRFASAVKEYEIYAEESKKYRSYRESWDGMLLMADCTIKMDKFDKGFELYDDAIHFAKSVQMNSCHIETHIRIGQVKEFLNKPEEALRHYQSGLAIARKFGLVEHQAKGLLHVGNLHRGLKNTQMADAHLRLAKDLITTSKLHHLNHLVDFYLGKLLMEIGNLTDAGLCLKRAIETSQKRDVNVYRSALCDYGAILVKEEKPKEALPLLEEALDFNAKFQDHSGMMRCYSHIITAYRDMGKEAEEKEATHRLTELNTILQKKGIAVPLNKHNLEEA